MNTTEAQKFQAAATIFPHLVPDFAIAEKIIDRLDATGKLATTEWANKIVAQSLLVFADTLEKGGREEYGAAYFNSHARPVVGWLRDMSNTLSSIDM